MLEQMQRGRDAQRHERLLDRLLPAQRHGDAPRRGHRPFHRGVRRRRAGGLPDGRVADGAFSAVGF